jgi:hypothetical protein
MPQAMSFMLTKDQMRRRRKDVTRRTKWARIKVGKIFQAVEKCQGLKKGEKQVKISLIRIKAFTFERVDAITQEEVLREGFEKMTPADFINFFCQHNKCGPAEKIARVEFEFPCIECESWRVMQDSPLRGVCNDCGAAWDWRTPEEIALVEGAPAFV